ncbi:hypothetical protein GGI04_003834 [Coemansia thaxteri]|uniref:Cytochrome P450 n=1 Tax=Coemansia thaxteri TaxID=2663907 RepID=A0A9W8BGM2_9FUNG|nr:hypothetical protein H4R26_004680 [Coemansia thaxteri]KAJ2001201.1 hypothetical protein GGI04_003834 [Coemansia thaxteri]KAJ2469159.1 hypothetical protein GGI02_003482 [Coemansia sp. RSA 2322]KAJ2475764.1 hypothetical protein EV174_005160 [Coemansia sp. RSA 2320]
MELLTVNGYMSQIAKALFANYGDIHVLMPNAVSIGNPADVRALLSNPVVRKADYYKTLRFTGTENTVSARDLELANMRHRQLGPYFNPSYLSKMENKVMRHGILSLRQKWDGLLAQSVDGRAEVNYCEDFLFLAFDTIGTLVLGRQIEELSANDTPTAKSIANTIMYLGVRAMFQLLPRWLAALVLRPWEGRYNKLSAHIHESIASRRELVAALARSGADEIKPADLLQAFIDAEDSESKTRMTPEQIHGECVLMMMAGSDTVSGTLTWAVHLLMLYPQHYGRAVAEVRSQFGQEHTITYSECRAQLPFVEACLYESLRLSPVTGGLLPRVSPKGGLTIQGHFIPEDTLIFVNMFAVNHHATVWDQPSLFNPQRFLDNDSARHNVLTFSMGKRVCPGRQLAWWEMLTVLANILKDYDWALPADYALLGPGVLDKHGHPRQMDETQFIIIKPARPERDCRLVISKHAAQPRV